MYPEYNIETRNLSESMHKFGSICIWSTTYGSKMQPRGIRSSKIMASWPNNDGQVLQDRFCLSAGSVQYYFKHSVQLEDQFHQHCFACVRWYIPHAESLSLYGNPIKVYRNKFYQGGPSSFIPVQRLFSRFASVELDYQLVSGFRTRWSNFFLFAWYFQKATYNGSLHGFKKRLITSGSFVFKIREA